MQIPGFLGPTYPGRSTSFESDRTINWFPELTDNKGAKSVIALVGTPGLRKACTAGAGPIRGSHTFNGYLYVVSGPNLYRMGATEAVSASLGTLSTIAGPVVMVDNGVLASGIGGNQLAIVDGVNLYLYDISSDTFTTMVPATLGFVPSHIAYLDGYFIAVEKDTMNYHVSDLYNGAVWNGLAQSPVSASPDLLKSVCTPHQELWLIKESTTEIWYNTGTATSVGSPFSRVTGAVMDYGTSAPYSVAVGDNSVFMLANVRVGGQGQLFGVVMISGYTPTLISPAAINYRIRQMTDIADAVGWTYSQEGHTFYVLTFPSGSTIVYDTTTRMWHERSSYLQGSEYVVRRHIANSFSALGSKLYVGHYNSGNIYEMSTEYYDDDGDPIISIRIVSHLFDPEDLGNVFIHRLKVDAEVGMGLETDTAQTLSLAILEDGGLLILADDPHPIYVAPEVVIPEPSMELSWSNDGGYTWSNPYPASMGKVGEYKKELKWRRLGYSKDKVFRLMISDKVKRVLLGGNMEASK